MTVEELIIRESVRQTMSDYTAATDGFDLAMLSKCFGPDGVLELPGGAAPLVGPASIETGLGAAMGGAASQRDRSDPSHVRHHVSSVRFRSVTAERVEVSSYFAVHTDVGLDHWGRYRDVLTPQRGRWLFAHRRISVDGFSPGSLMA